MKTIQVAVASPLTGDETFMLIEDLWQTTNADLLEILERAQLIALKEPMYAEPILLRVDGEWVYSAYNRHEEIILYGWGKLDRLKSYLRWNLDWHLCHTVCRLNVDSVIPMRWLFRNRVLYQYLQWDGTPDAKAAKVAVEEGVRRMEAEAEAKKLSPEMEARVAEAKLSLRRACRSLSGGGYVELPLQETVTASDGEVELLVGYSADDGSLRATVKLPDDLVEPAQRDGTLSIMFVELGRPHLYDLSVHAGIGLRTEPVRLPRGHLKYHTHATITPPYQYWRYL